MPRFAFLVLAIASLVPAFTSAQNIPSARPGVAPTQSRPSPLAPYAGHWTGSFEDKPWLTLSLSLAGDKLSGSLRHPRNIEMNDNGELKKISEEVVTEAVVEAVVNPDGLLLTVKDPEAQSSDRYLMKLTGDTTAEIKMIGMVMPPGMPKPKPWKLAKSGAPSLPKR
jgi:hypothetical protein